MAHAVKRILDDNELTFPPGEDRCLPWSQINIMSAIVVTEVGGFDNTRDALFQLLQLADKHSLES